MRLGGEYSTRTGGVAVFGRRTGRGFDKPPKPPVPGLTDVCGRLSTSFGKGERDSGLGLELAFAEGLGLARLEGLYGRSAGICDLSECPHNGDGGKKVVLNSIARGQCATTWIFACWLFSFVGALGALIQAKAGA